MKAPRHKQPAHTQRTVCYQAIAQYPKSFNIHKETLRLTPKGSAIVPMPIPSAARCLKQARAVVEEAICQERQAPQDIFTNTNLSTLKK